MIKLHGDSGFTIEDFQTLIMWHKLAFKKRGPNTEDNNVLLKIQAFLLLRIEHQKELESMFGRK